ncbi:MAG: hypothetical protein R3E72_02215 [Steroidobacteraceae bacterium]
MSRFISLATVVLLTLGSGLLDARGFVLAARAWPAGRLHLQWGLAALLCFVGGLTLYILAVRFMQNVGVTGVALQSALWFIITAIGIAVMDGSILQWSRSQQMVGLSVAVGLGWLIATTRTHV